MSTPRRRSTEEVLRELVRNATIRAVIEHYAATPPSPALARAKAQWSALLLKERERVNPNELAKLRIERWKLSRGQLSAALLALDPITDVDEVRMINMVRAMLDKKIADAGGT